MISPSSALPILFLINLPPFSQSSSSGCRRSHLARSPPLPRSPPVAACIHLPPSQKPFSLLLPWMAAAAARWEISVWEKRKGEGGRPFLPPYLTPSSSLQSGTVPQTDRPTGSFLFFFLHPCPTPFWRLGRGRRKRKKGWMEEVGSGPGEGGMIESTFLVPKGEGAIAECGSGGEKNEWGSIWRKGKS